jgi:hypothetical protein
MTEAQEVVKDTLLDHDRTFRCKSYIERDRYIDGRRPRDYEQDLDVMEGDSGITNAHVLMIIIQKLVSLQRRVQGNIISKGKQKLQQLNEKIGKLYEDIDQIKEGDPREGELTEKLAVLKMELRDYTENVDKQKGLE